METITGDNTWRQSLGTITGDNTWETILHENGGRVILYWFQIKWTGDRPSFSSTSCTLYLCHLDIELNSKTLYLDLRRKEATEIRQTAGDLVMWNPRETS